MNEKRINIGPISRFGPIEQEVLSWTAEFRYAGTRWKPSQIAAVRDRLAYWYKLESGGQNPPDDYLKGYLSLSQKLKESLWTATLPKSIETYFLPEEEIEPARFGFLVQDPARYGEYIRLTEDQVSHYDWSTLELVTDNVLLGYRLIGRAKCYHPDTYISHYRGTECPQTGYVDEADFRVCAECGEEEGPL